VAVHCLVGLPLLCTLERSAVDSSAVNLPVGAEPANTTGSVPLEKKVREAIASPSEVCTLFARRTRVYFSNAILSPAEKSSMATKKKGKKKGSARKSAKRTVKRPAKKAAKKKTKRVPNAAFMRPMQPDDALGAVVGSSPMPRTEITKKIWGYIKRNGLQDSKERRMINADDRLRVVFGGKKQVSMFEMTKLVNKHMK
jgi:chromatin remodeling complex protein RSC6